MSLSRFLITNAFRAWSPADRNLPERRVSISPGARPLFIDQTDPEGLFIKFVQGGSWYEAERDEFVRSTMPSCEHRPLSAQRGG
jgi:hypothetical protein